VVPAAVQAARAYDAACRDIKGSEAVCNFPETELERHNAQQAIMKAARWGLPAACLLPAWQHALLLGTYCAGRLPARRLLPGYKLSCPDGYR
jgi:hypothetical protein